MTTSQRNTDQDWKQVAEEDPYWGVLSQDEYRKEAMDANKLKQFMASGETYTGDLFSFIRRTSVARILSNARP